MEWVVISLLSAVTYALYAAFLNRHKKIDPVILNLGLMLAELPIVIILFMLNPVVGSLHFFILLACLSVLNVLGFVLSTKAIHMSGLGLTIPFLSFTPLFLIAVSFFALHEVPSMHGLIGIVVIVIGAYVLNISGTQKHFLDPIKNLAKEKGSLLMLLVSFIFAFTATLYKITSQMVPRLTFMAYLVVFELIVVSILSLVMFRKDTLKKLSFHKRWKEFLMGGAVFLLDGILFAYAFQYAGALVSYAVSLRRTSILFSVIFGYIFFHEKDFRQKMLGSAIMVAGVIIISLLG